MSKRKRLSAEDAIQNILQFVNEDSDDETSDLEDLYGEEEFVADESVEGNENADT